MSLDSLIATTQLLQTSVEALAALGAELRIRREGLPADSEVSLRLRNVVHALHPDLLEGVTADQEEAALVIIQSAFGQAAELLADPAREPGWWSEDPEVLQGQGQASRRFVRAIDALAAERPDLRRVLHEKGAFLDVGTGVGWLAIEAARTWPALRCVGIDVWEPALRLARANLAGAGMEERVEVRLQGVEQLDDREAFSLAWLPPFVPISVIPTALRNLHRALVPGGWLVVSLLGAMPDPLSQALAALKLARHGTYAWTASEAEQQLRRLGLASVETFLLNPMTVIVVGKKSGSVG